MGWDVNVHVNLQKQLIVRTRGVGWGGGVGCKRSCELADDDDATNADDDDVMMMMIMMMMMMVMMMMM